MTDNTENKEKTRRIRIVTYGIILVGVSAFVAAYFYMAHPASPASAGLAPKRTPSVVDAQTVARLVGHPPKGETPFSNAMIIRDAIRSGDYPKAEHEAEAVLKESRIGAWSYAPFTLVIESATQPSAAAFSEHMDGWVKKYPQSALALLYRASFEYWQGYWYRGSGFSSTVSKRNKKIFWKDIEKARTDVLKSIKLNPDIPYSYNLQLMIMRSTDQNANQAAAFQKAIARFPGYFDLYETRLKALQPKWGGSLSSMYDFINRYVETKPKDSPIRLMYLVMYSDLLNSASITCEDQKISGYKKKECVSLVMRHITSDALEESAYNSLKLYTPANAYSFSQALGTILYKMIYTPWAEQDSGAFLQLAAHAMHSDTQLVSNDTTKNNYMIDRMASFIWYRRSQFENVATLDKRALEDLENMDFPSENARNEAKATIYDEMASMYNRQDRYKTVIAYTKAIDKLLGGAGVDSDMSGIQCFSYFKLHAFDAGVQTCQAAITNNGDLQTRYWLARIHEAMHKTDLALKEYKVIAQSQSQFCQYAATEVSIIYDKRKKWQKALKALNASPCLFNEDREKPSDLAIDFNNRCYDKMKLGELKGALQDCTISLQYGNLPDAYAKEEKLMQMLKMKKEAKKAPIPRSQTPSSAPGVTATS